MIDGVSHGIHVKVVIDRYRVSRSLGLICSNKCYKHKASRALENEVLIDQLSSGFLGRGITNEEIHFARIYLWSFQGYTRALTFPSLSHSSEFDYCLPSLLCDDQNTYIASFQSLICPNKPIYMPRSRQFPAQIRLCRIDNENATLAEFAAVCKAPNALRIMTKEGSS